MRRTALIAAALLVVSASAQAGQTRNLSLASSHPPISAPLPPTQVSAPRIAEAPAQPVAAAVVPAPVATPVPAVPAPVSAAPETGAPPVATAPVPPPLPAAAAPEVATPATSEAPKFVERPTVAPATTDAPKVDDGKPARRAERRHRGGGSWTAGRIMGELRRYGISYGYGGW
jgi:translation initiation factor IF-2